jgi:hypothetical protein
MSDAIEVRRVVVVIREQILAALGKGKSYIEDNQLSVKALFDAYGLLDPAGAQRVLQAATQPSDKEFEVMRISRQEKIPMVDAEKIYAARKG